MEFLKYEEEILKFWEESKIYERARKKGRKLFRFLDGPPFTSGEVHLGTVFNKVLKDIVLRSRRMMGYRVLDTPGYDMHGLPIEVNVEKKMGIKNKREILKFGIKEFVEECKRFSFSNMYKMNEDFQTLGVWMDWKKPYMTASNEYIENVWHIIKVAYEKGMLYQGDKVLPWCYRCATALAKHELEYKKLEDLSIYVKFKLKGKENEFLVIWTTTPWTLVSNLAVMANPSGEYCRFRVGDEIWVMARSGGERLLQKFGINYEIIDTFLGSELENTSYEFPFEEEVQSHRWLEEKYGAHKVILSEEYVDVNEGTGLVHCAPGCGPEDFEVGKKYGLPAFSPVDEDGNFTEEAGEFNGKFVKGDVEREIIEILGRKGLLVGEEKVIHEYPHCFRCKRAVIFRATRQWFLAVARFRDQILKENEAVNWIPAWGKQWFNNWVAQLEDWCISRQRFWGIPLPIFICNKCGEIKVVGSKAELERLAQVKVKDLHAGEVDQITFRCKCGGEMKRIRDVADVWLDSGSAPFASLDYLRNSKQFFQYFPFDFIVEGKDQIRGWFNVLFCVSMLLTGKAPYKNVYMHGFITDEKGREMHRSLGNYVTPSQVLPKYGRDGLRLYYMLNSSPGEDVKLVWKELEEAVKQLNIIWNTHLFILKQAKFFGMRLDPELKITGLGIGERWILYELYSMLQQVEELYLKFDVTRATKLIIDFLVEKLSRGYIHLIREEMYESISAKVPLNVLFHVYLTALKALAPITPIICEKIYQDLKEVAELGPSIHLEKWPKVKRSFLSQKFKEELTVLFQVLEKGKQLRDLSKLKMRQPLKEMLIVADNLGLRRIVEKNKVFLKKALNILEIKCFTRREFERKFRLRNKIFPHAEQLSKKFPPAVVTQLIGNIIGRSQEDLLKELNTLGGINVKLSDGNVIKLGEEDFLFGYELPKQYVFTSISRDLLILNVEVDRELKLLGLLRELVRAVQEERKKMGLEKGEQVSLAVNSNEEVELFLKQNEEFIKRRTNCRLTFSTQKLLHRLKAYEFELSFEVKKI
ncbi:MAG: isoleucine--tRNA ligase [Candidatus Nanoarchaeia archaeon]|nr:isoleucine--tRNA ligase [Candidatus Haiyanarchaeum thermophilum]MCW1303148.1 isoleucine--tRNA ligase [Candidatus Haiyanarchaeum thermophilum]MCW1303813.1 isoleucine--tRNA ligase [Candidatus Haiyanarchaeum thermophilum]MCW1306570.1 isoleucine--tRNA ligase [Candidatus Haiyanarchaeum thermophilum]MCW1306984.1 isoleucine--tRNA ligase [Candidatus Haiyanarchaeum thermophilum]